MMVVDNTNAADAQAAGRLAEEKRAEEKRREYIMTVFAKYDERQSSSEAAAINSGSAAVKALFLLNGGACIALLGFLSSTFSSAKRTPGEAIAAKFGAFFGVASTVQAETALIGQITAALTWFAWGAGFAVLGSALAYFVNYFTAISFGKMKRNWEWPFVHDTTASKRLETTAEVFTLAAFTSGTVSFGLFIGGLFRVQNLF